MKTEPDVFSIDDLFGAKNKTAAWEGVRNYQARNFMRDDFKVGDEVLIYHSSCAQPGVAGTARVVKAFYSDDSALDLNSAYFDMLSFKNGMSRWGMVDVKGVEKFSKVFTLKTIKGDKFLQNMLVCQKGSRLSIQPVKEQEFLYFKLSFTMI